jgi:CheY-like chemotaxis protein
MQNLTALLIDDDEPTNIFNDIMFRRSGLFSSWKIVDSALAGLEYLLTSKVVPDVIFLDINMPVHTGWDFLERYAEAPIVDKCDHVIMLTTSSSGFDIKKSENFCAVRNFKEKPLRTSVIEEIVGQLTITPSCH